MKWTLGRGVGVIGAAAVVAGVFGTGLAGAKDDQFKGQTYEKASASISQWGTPVISTRVGDYLPTEQCIVARSQHHKGDTKVYLSLNCNDTTALNGHAGNSVVTPEGRQAVELRQRAQNASADYDKSIASGTTPSCLSTPGAIKWCTKICTEAKVCTAGLESALGL